MTPNEFNSFLFKLANSTNKKATAEEFYKQMVEKYGNQFDTNGLIDELIDILNYLKVI